MDVPYEDYLRADDGTWYGADASREELDALYAQAEVDQGEQGEPPRCETDGCSNWSMTVCGRCNRERCAVCAYWDEDGSFCFHEGCARSNEM
jgi:hypothetical protein